MDKLLKSIKELNTLLKFIKQVKDNPLVPSPKMPGIKKLGSMKAQKITKIPGIAPNTLKDPNKIAQQLKNPAPKKPKMEILKTTSSGQWELLEKAVWEHAPHIKSQDCKCSGASRGDNMHHYSCVDANPRPPQINPHVEKINEDNYIIHHPKGKIPVYTDGDWPSISYNRGDFGEHYASLGYGFLEEDMSDETWNHVLRGLKHIYDVKGQKIHPDFQSKIDAL